MATGKRLFALRSVYWAIPEIRHTSPKEDMGSKQFYPHFSLGIQKKKKKIITFLVARVQKTWEFLQTYLLYLIQETGNSHCFFFFYNFENSYLLKTNLRLRIPKFELLTNSHYSHSFVQNSVQLDRICNWKQNQLFKIAEITLFGNQKVTSEQGII